MEKIIVNQDNKVWKDSSDRIIKTRPFSEDVLQDGLVFWGNSKPENLTIVDGLVSEAFDIRDTEHNWALKMTQATVVKRPSFDVNNILFNGVKLLQSSTSYIIKDMFIVFKYYTTNYQVSGVGTSGGNVLGIYELSTRNFVSAVFQNYYRNNTLESAGSQPATKTIFSSTGNNYNSGVAFSPRVGSVDNANNSSINVYEFGFYSKILSASERQYNINALNEKWKIF